MQVETGYSQLQLTGKSERRAVLFEKLPFAAVCGPGFPPDPGTKIISVVFGGLLAPSGSLINS